MFFFIRIHKIYMEDFELQHADIAEDEEILKRINDHVEYRQKMEKTREAAF